MASWRAAAVLVLAVALPIGHARARTGPADTGVCAPHIRRAQHGSPAAIRTPHAMHDAAPEPERAVMDGHWTGSPVSAPRSSACVASLNLRGGKQRVRRGPRSAGGGDAPNGGDAVRVGYSADEFAALSKGVTQQVQGKFEAQMAKESREAEEVRRKLRSKKKKRLRKNQGTFVPSTKNRARSVERTLPRKGHLMPE